MFVFSLAYRRTMESVVIAKSKILCCILAMIDVHYPRLWLCCIIELAQVQLRIIGKAQDCVDVSAQRGLLIDLKMG